MLERNGLTRGDRRRNRQTGSIRQVVPPELAILAIDLGEDKQVAVVMDPSNEPVPKLPTLVDRTWQNKNRIFPVQGPDVMVKPVRTRSRQAPNATAARAVSATSPACHPGLTAGYRTSGGRPSDGRR
jgi:hypothetical protein